MRVRRSLLWLVTLLLLVAAVLRIAGVTRLPSGFNDDELTDIRVAETVRVGSIASFYNVGNASREGLYPILQTIVTGVLGEGVLFHRLLSIGCGLLSVALMYALGRRLFGDFVGLVAAITLTVSFWPLFLSRSATRETLLLPLILAVLWTLTRAYHLRQAILAERPVTLTFTALGVLIAALIYVQWTGLMILPLLAIFLAYLLLSRQPISRRIVGYSAFALLVGTILGIPYLTFTLRAVTLSGLHVFWINRPETFFTLFKTIFQTLISLVLRGDPMLQHNLPGNPLLGIVGAVLFLIGLISVGPRWRSPNVMLILLTLILGLIPGAWSRTAPDFANIILALPAIMILVGLGTETAIQRVAQRAGKIVDPLRSLPVMALTVLITAISAGWVAHDLFQVWPQSDSFDTAYHAAIGRIAAYLDRTQDNFPTSICTDNVAGDDHTFSDPILLKLMMHRANPNVRFSDCVNGLVLADGGTLQRLAFTNPRAIQALSPLFRDWLVHTRPIESALLQPGSMLLFDTAKELADAFGKQVYQPVAWGPDKDNGVAFPVRMGGYLTFEGYAIVPGTTFKPGDMVTLVTYWRADGPQIPDLRMFFHLLRNPNSEPVAQNDLLSIDPTVLRDRDVFIQVLTVTLPADFPAGDYYVSVGAYSTSTGARLPVYQADTQRSDRLFLGTITATQ